MSGDVDFGKLLLGGYTMIVGVEDHPEGGLKVYIGARYLNKYVWTTDPEAVAEIRRSWPPFGHLVMAVPPADHIFEDPREGNNERVAGV